MTRVEWNQDKVMDRVIKVVDDATAEGARVIRNELEISIPVLSGDLLKSLKVLPSKYGKVNGYIIGFFSSEKVDKWEKSLSARAVFVEFGHAAPNMGRDSVARKDIVKAVPRHPFVRPSIDRAVPQIKNAFRKKRL